MTLSPSEISEKVAVLTTALTEKYPECVVIFDEPNFSSGYPSVELDFTQNGEYIIIKLEDAYASDSLYGSKRDLKDRLAWEFMDCNSGFLSVSDAYFSSSVESVISELGEFMLHLKDDRPTIEQEMTEKFTLIRDELSSIYPDMKSDPGYRFSVVPGDRTPRLNVYIERSYPGISGVDLDLWGEMLGTFEEYWDFYLVGNSKENFVWHIENENDFDFIHQPLGNDLGWSSTNEEVLNAIRGILDAYAERITSS